MIEDLNFQRISVVLNLTGNNKHIYIMLKQIAFKWLKILFKPKNLWNYSDAILWRHTILSITEFAGRQKYDAN